VIKEVSDDLKCKHYSDFLNEPTYFRRTGSDLRHRPLRVNEEITVRMLHDATVFFSREILRVNMDGDVREIG
jgi:hypothetical protein